MNDLVSCFQFFDFRATMDQKCPEGYDGIDANMEMMLMIRVFCIEQARRDLADNEKEAEDYDEMEEDYEYEKSWNGKEILPARILSLTG